MTAYRPLRGWLSNAAPAGRGPVAGSTRRRHVGVSRSDYDALGALDEHGSLTPGELGTLLSLTPGSVTALVDRLEQLGWASRNRHPQDRRRVVVTLTQRAWQLGQDELNPYLDAVDAAARQLSNGERAVVVRFLDDLVDKIATPHAPKAAANSRVADRAMRSRFGHSVRWLSHRLGVRERPCRTLG
jgi:DNA-binding MarR family transcriptional regulator